MTDLFGPVIYAYTREQAIEDGMLIPIDSLDLRVESIGREAGYLLPVYLTAGVNALVEQAVNDPDLMNDRAGVAWDILWMGKVFAFGRMKAGATQAGFPVIIGRRTEHLILGFDGEAFTVFMPGED